MTSKKTTKKQSAKSTTKKTVKKKTVKKKVAEVSKPSTPSKFVSTEKLHTATIFLIGVNLGLLLLVLPGTVRRGGLFSISRPVSFESQVRTWSKDYPVLLRDKWSWCYRDAVQNWSTDQKLREDVRTKANSVLTESDKKTLEPLRDKITEAVPKQKGELKETYREIGDGLKVDGWTPPEILPPAISSGVGEKPEADCPDGNCKPQKTYVTPTRRLFRR